MAGNEVSLICRRKQTLPPGNASEDQLLKHPLKSKTPLVWNTGQHRKSPTSIWPVSFYLYLLNPP